MNTTLFKAILSMDAYNRGYNAGIDFRLIDDISGLPIADSDTIYTNATGTHYAQIGNSTVFMTRGQAEAEAISFYGIAYQLSTGEKVIAYRGTDNVGLDSLTGFGIGAGNPREQQAIMAFNFYNAVANTPEPHTANISLTGHSLGGGLAGVVGGE